MNRKTLFWLWAIFMLGAAIKLSAQGTTFTYQGRLDNSGNPANGYYDLRFTLYNAATNGSIISVPQTNFAVNVSGGLFTTNLDFGSVFTGDSYWLSIGVRTNGDTNAFTVLWPRQQILPVPYAIFANSASNLIGTLSASKLTGTLASAQVSGIYGGEVSFTNGGNNFSGTFVGDGSSLNNLNGSHIASGTVADARLSTNVALLNANQTFTGNNQFNGVNTFTNWNNSFTGSFFGNGLVGWIPVSGTTQQAERDHGYMLTSPGLATVTLPVNAGLAIGDIVRVSGAGPGGWLVKANSGQSIFGNLASYGSSYLLKSASGDDYYDVAASADGVRVYAVGNDLTGVYASSDSGHTFTQVSGTQLSGYWQSIACSANGKIVYAVPGGGGYIRVSTDGGSTWFTSGTSATFISCTADGSVVFYTGNIVCSGNGTYLAKFTSSSISVSTNSGASWFVVNVPASNLSCLAVSSDCTKLVAGISNGFLYASANQGATWTAITSTNQYWSGAWMSPDGSKLAATVIKNGGINGGVYYTSVSIQPNTVSTNISGSQGAAVELQYIGNSQFMPVSSTGDIWAN